MDASVRTSNGLNPSQVIGHGKLMGALREPCSSRFPGDVFSQKGREAVGYDHRDKRAPIQPGSPRARRCPGRIGSGGYPMASATLIASPEEPPISGIVDRQGDYRYGRGRGLQAFSGGSLGVFRAPNAQLHDPGDEQYLPMLRTRITGRETVTVDRVDQTRVPAYRMDRP